MRPWPLRWRMFAWFLGLGTLLVLAASVAHYLEAREALLEILDRSLFERNEDLLARGGTPDPGHAAPRPGPRARVRGSEVYAPGDVAPSKRSAWLAGRPPLVAADRLAVLRAGRHATLAWTEELPDLGAVRVRAGGARDPDGALRIVASLEDLGEVNAELRDVLAWSGVTLGVALLFAVLGAGLAVRSLTRPLARIADAADRVESTHEVVPMPAPGAGDEVDRLAGALDRAFARLRDAVDREARFAADAAHELRTPLAVILTQAQVALRREREPGQYREALAEVAAAAERMQRTVEALLVAVKGGADAEAVRRGRADLAAVARAEVEAATAAARRRNVALVVSAAEPVPVAGDERLLAVLVRNLVENAISYSPDAGTVTATIGSDGTAAVLVVADEGPGIPAEALPRVFERFFRVDDSRSRSTGGTGLGLSLVKFVADLHGGTAALDSAPGRGTRVTVRLPLAPRDLP